jgi:HD-like signal output (HDOD) protein
MGYRVLFVDDDRGVLRSLERLISLKNEWDAVCVSSGQEALSTLSNDAFDVVVADVDMPAMNGTVLLGEVQRLHPEVIRIHLTGSSDPSAAFRAVPVAHQLLTKPLEREGLFRVIDQAACLRGILTNGALRKLLGATDELPAAPTMYLELTSCLTREDCSFADVARIVARDTAMCASILKLVNSAFFGSPKQVTNITEAVSFLGISRIKGLVLTLGVIRMLQAARSLKGFSIEYIQRHSMLTSLIARSLDSQLDQDDVGMAGMLHELGQLLVASRRPDLYAKVLAVAGERPLQEAEQEILGATHAEVGAYLLGLWGLPAPIIEAIAFHHEPNKSTIGGFGVPQALYVADRLAAEHEPQSAKISHTVHDELDEELLESMGVSHRLTIWRARAAAFAERVSSDGSS